MMAKLVRELRRYEMSQNDRAASQKVDLVLGI